MGSIRRQRVQSGLGALSAMIGLVLTTLAAAAEQPKGAAMQAAPVVAAQALPHTMILLDASADMSRVVSGSPKMELQRHALASLAVNSLQVAAYGGQRCSGFAMLESDAVSNSLKTMAPSGRRNLVAALDAVIAAFPEEAPVKRVVAIVGGPNQCLAAICAHAGRLKEQHPEFIVDLIGFGLSDRAAANIDCIAANTGGRFTRAEAATLATTLSLALRMPAASPNGQAAFGGESRPEPMPLASPSPVPPSPRLAEMLDDGVLDPAFTSVSVDWRMTGPESFVPQGLRLMASLKPDGTRLLSGTRFELLRADKAGVYRLIARTERTGHPLFAVPAGRYLARISRGGAVRDVEVWAPEKGVSTRTISLDAGQLALAALAGGRPASLGAEFHIRRLDGPGPTVTISGRGRALATVPAGRYRVRALIDQASAERIVEVRPGEIAAAGLNVPIGFVRVALTVTSAGAAADPLTPPVISIVRNGREIARAVGESPLFRVAPGPYTVIARVGQIEAERDVVADVGALVDVALTLNQGPASAADAGKSQHRKRVLIAEQPVVSATVTSR